jgi:hypothetical protein
VRVLLDECVDRRLAAGIEGHDVKTVPEAGWSGLKNGPSPSSCCVHNPIVLSICAA